VALTSYTTEYLSEMLVKLKEYDKDHEENNHLSSFLGTLQRFNHDIKLNSKIENSITHYFDYRWRKNKLFPFSTEGDLLLYDQLPTEAKIKLCSDFLFKDFFFVFSRYFLQLQQA